MTRDLSLEYGFVKWHSTNFSQLNVLLFMKAVWENFTFHVAQYILSSEIIRSYYEMYHFIWDIQVRWIGWAWLAQLVRYLPSSHKVPSSISGFAEIWIFVQPSFLPELLIILLGANLQWISVLYRPGGVKTLIHITLQKPEISAGSMGH